MDRRLIGGEVDECMDEWRVDKHESIVIDTLLYINEQK